MLFFQMRNGNTLKTSLALQKIYDFFCDLDKEEKGYILEVSNSIKILYETLAKLICHPLQRSPQNEAFYNPMPVFQERGTVGQYS